MLNSIVIVYGLMSLDSIRIWKKNTIALEIVIGEIVVEMGHKCIECEHCTLIWRSMMDHFVKNHEDKDARDWMEVDIQM
jgi:hypothetical protein